MYNNIGNIEFYFGKKIASKLSFNIFVYFVFYKYIVVKILEIRK